ncbi:xanthine dehydrogenase accessory protein XdhC [Reinekea marinisedimentorum]|uniref:Xanthine dehydrogenase accessory factor n=1 Tax=Reinekea marinisedimentorum TaxID=230495 RepID=A0A4R3I4Q3_9GAMM|nr:xanthine dehydrogenase accessory protein XdhC [Reinekea marinisedimentorum]TCS38959.1 xanthine dehydrogenase accessory factor [Reinekea marinisedimentorum]
MLNKDTAGFHPQSWSEAVHQLTQASENYVLVTILGTAGSTPRANGTKMVITASDIYDTIGGGHLEFKVIEKARQLLTESKAVQQVENFPLAAKLGQCCGGSVAVLFEMMVVQQPTIQVHGAGHVGHALVQILSQLPLRIQWVDSRVDLFPEQVASNVDCIAEPYPEDAVKDAPENSLFIVLTHNHQLDFTLTEKIIARGDAAYLGVIGSDTKAKRFRMRLEHKGYSQAQVDQMTSPVGLAEVGGKLPMEVAVSIAGQVISIYQQGATKQKRAGLSWKQLQNEIALPDVAEHAPSETEN